MKQSIVKLVIMMGFLVLVTVACEFGFERARPTYVNYILDSTCDRNNVATYLSPRESQAIQSYLNQTSSYRLDLYEDDAYINDDFAELLQLNIDIYVGYGIRINVVQPTEDFRNNSIQAAAASLQRMDGTSYNEVEIQLIHQELNDDTLGLRFKISDKKNNCEDFLNINVLI